MQQDRQKRHCPVLTYHDIRRRAVCAHDRLHQSWVLFDEDRRDRKSTSTRLPPFTQFRAACADSNLATSSCPRHREVLPAVDSRRPRHTRCGRRRPHQYPTCGRLQGASVSVPHCGRQGAREPRDLALHPPPDGKHECLPHSLPHCPEGYWAYPMRIARPQHKGGDRPISCSSGRMGNRIARD